MKDGVRWGSTGWLGVDDHVLSLSLSSTPHIMYPPWNTSFLTIFILCYFIFHRHMWIFPLGLELFLCGVPNSNLFFLLFLHDFQVIFPSIRYRLYPISSLARSHAHTIMNTTKGKSDSLTSAQTGVLHRFSPPTQNVSLCAEREMKSIQGYHGENLKIDN